MKQMKIQYGTQIIHFTVEYRKRKTIEIGVEALDIISVVVPEGISDDVVLVHVKKKAKWIVQKLHEIEGIQANKLNREYVNGESFMYLGRNYSLKIIDDSKVKKPVAKLYQGKFIIDSPSRDQSKLKISMEAWYRKKTLEKVTERIDYYQRNFKDRPSDIKVKEQKKRWASCTSKKELLFNWRCAMAPSWVLDYIVVHEMCHMVHMDHSSDFWTMVERILPDYDRRREWLKNYGIKMDL